MSSDTENSILSDDFINDITEGSYLSNEITEFDIQNLLNNELNTRISLLDYHLESLNNFYDTSIKTLGSIIEIAIKNER